MKIECFYLPKNWRRLRFNHLWREPSCRLPRSADDPDCADERGHIRRSSLLLGICDWLRPNLQRLRLLQLGDGPSGGTVKSG